MPTGDQTGAPWTCGPLGPNGIVAYCVAFYFASHSPMLYRIHGGQVRGYEQGQRLLCI
ncbi:DarT ssDNA thymidine ADP-ribosyltransferase family protein [Salinactinospora qingdaonensis]|uniref:DarT ssDNA thymidine ADP-ribosyltransferase family protein n=1 Tax=Salinactinospora qingdaonensis TaxID=702744 RepID=UPI003CD06DE1